MKKGILILSCMIGVFTACQDDETPTPNAIAAEEAAVMVASSLASNAAGFSQVSSASANKAEDILAENEAGRVAACGLAQSLDLSGNSPVGGTYTWSYNFSYNFRLNCNTDEVPDNITVDLSYSGAFDGPKSGFEFSGLSDLELKGLSPATEYFILDGMYKRAGSFEIKEGAQKAGSNSLEFSINDVEVDKTTHKMMSGTSSFLLTGTVSGKGNFNYEGTVTFTGNDSADIMIKKEIFLVNLKDGTVTPK